jgi:hypothetical protein
MSRKQSEIVSKLVTLAGGNLELVEEALRESANEAGTAKLDDVIDYISSHRERHLEPRREQRSGIRDHERQGSEVA